MIFLLATSDGKDAKLRALSPWWEGPCGNKLTHALFDCCARGLKFNRPLQPWTFSFEVDRNDDSVVFVVPNVCGHIFLQHLSHGEDRYFLARIIYTVDILCSHEVRILVPDLLFSHVISGQMNRPLLPLTILDFFCNSWIHVNYLRPRSGLVS